MGIEGGPDETRQGKRERAVSLLLCLWVIYGPGPRKKKWPFIGEDVKKIERSEPQGLIS